jgi:hypothetical protein
MATEKEFSDWEWWQSVGEPLDLKLYGWTGRYRATFICGKDGQSTIDIDRWTANKILALAKRAEIAETATALHVDRHNCVFIINGCAHPHRCLDKCMGVVMA